MAKHKATIEQLRQAIQRDGRSLYAIGKKSGLRVAPLQRFVAREHGITLDSAEKLAAALGFRLALVKRS